MNDPRGERVSELERDFPTFQVWCVPHAVGPYGWHARKWDAEATPANTLSASSADGLRKLLEAEVEK